jgi:hypothetical protein
MFGFQKRFALRDTWLRVMLILCPERTLLSQISHFAINRPLSNEPKHSNRNLSA